MNSYEMKMRKFMLVLYLYCKDEYFIPFLVILLGGEESKRLILSPKAKWHRLDHIQNA